MIYIANAFALGMLPDGLCIAVKTLPSSQEAGDMMCSDANRHGVSLHSVVGHADTAAVFEGLLQLPVAFNRESVTLQDGDILYIGQLAGGRLPEGVTTLPEGFQIIWRRVQVYKQGF